MRKAARLFEIIQILRLARSPTTAAAIAGQLEVTQRSIYRDIAALQAMRVPIEGERGLGYILRPGFTLPPLMFTAEEVEAVVLGLGFLDRTGDSSLITSAHSARSKIAAALPQPLQQALTSRSLHAWGPIARPPDQVDPALLRRAIREEAKLALDYRDGEGRTSRRVIWPLALIYVDDAITLTAWCELRQAIRNFRIDRMLACSAEGGNFKGQGDRLRQQWIAGWR